MIEDSLSTVSMRKTILKDFMFFVAAMYPTYRFSPHNLFIIKKLQEFATSPDLNRLIISAPPRHGKSFLSTNLFPAWLYAKNPALKVISCCYNQELANENGKKVIDLINSPSYTELFPSTKILGVGRKGNFFETVSPTDKPLDKGLYRGVGVNGTITGRGGDLLICDDIIKNSTDAESKAYLKTIWDWANSTFFSRAEKGSKIIILNTIWSEQDLIGRLLETEPERWQYINLPALCEDPDSDPLGRQLNDPLWEELIGTEELLQIKKRDPKTFYTLYQGMPAKAAAVSGTSLSEDFFTIVPLSDLKGETVKKTFLSIDSASKISPTNDETAICLFAVTSSNKIYLIESWCGRFEAPELLNLTNLIIENKNPDQILIEDASSGIGLIQFLNLNNRLSRKVVPIKANTKKKVEILKTFTEAISFNILENVSHVNKITDQLLSYPLGDHDDFVSSVCNFLAHLIETKSIGIIKDKKDGDSFTKDKVCNLLKRKKKIFQY